MLDQNVPNPLAKNPNFHTHKVFAAIGIILIVMIIIGGGIWYFVQSAEDKAGTIEETITKVATTSAKTTTKSVTKDETANWKTYTSTKFKYSIKYPEDWSQSVTTGYLDEKNQTQWESLLLNRTESEPRNNGKPNLNIYGNFEGDWCNPGADGAESCSTETFIINDVEFTKKTYLTGTEKGNQVIYQSNKEIIIFANPNSDNGLMSKVIETLKFTN